MAENLIKKPKKRFILDSLFQNDTDWEARNAWMQRAALTLLNPDFLILMSL
ncbi:MAG: hypothetical protein ACXWRZ_15410 [Bdellovibrio sp.]